MLCVNPSPVSGACSYWLPPRAGLKGSAQGYPEAFKPLGLALARSIQHPKADVQCKPPTPSCAPAFWEHGLHAVSTGDGPPLGGTSLLLPTDPLTHFWVWESEHARSPSFRPSAEVLPLTIAHAAVSPLPSPFAAEQTEALRWEGPCDYTTTHSRTTILCPPEPG